MFIFISVIYFLILSGTIGSACKKISVWTNGQLCGVDKSDYWPACSHFNVLP